MSRVADALGGFPLTTLTVLVVCVAVQAVVFLFEPQVLDYAINARSVLYAGEYYRILTAAVMHAGLMHIVFNMMSACAIGSGLERTLGTLGLAFTILWSIVLCGAVYVAGEWAMTFWITGDPAYLLQNAVGFSGVIFTLALLESFTSPPTATRSIFGFFQVPTRLYPFVLLVVLQLMMPGVSMAGHLGGIIVGLLHVYGFTRFLLPTPAFLKQMENWSALSRVVSKRSFVPVPTPLTEQARLISSPSAAGGALQGAVSGVRYVVTAAWWVVSTVLHVLGCESRSGGDGSSGGGSNGIGRRANNASWSGGGGGARLGDLESQQRGGGS